VGDLFSVTITKLLFSKTFLTVLVGELLKAPWIINVIEYLLYQPDI